MEHPSDTHQQPPQVLDDSDKRLVHRIATAVQRDLKLSSEVVEYGDLVGFGCVGLLEARMRFETERNSDFNFYAARCIRGAILDGLRKMTRLPRRAHQMLRLSAPTEEPRVQVTDALDHVLAAGRLLSRAGFVIGHSPYPTEPVPDQPSPEVLVHRKLVCERVCAIIAELGEPDREIARQRLLEDRPLAEIAQGLGISRPWAHRVLERAVRNIILAMDA